MKKAIKITIAICFFGGWIYGLGFVDYGTTELSNGRHLARETGTARLHLVYQYGGTTMRGYSLNGGDT